MSKFPKAFKYKIVQEYLNTAISMASLARKYGIKSRTTVYKWVTQYQVFSDADLEVRSPKFIYTGSFKVKVLKWL